MPGSFPRQVAFLILALFGSTRAADAQAPFTEEASARGVDFVTYGGFSQFGRGVGLNDLDLDGDLDLLVTGRFDGKVGVFENDGTGNFTDRTDATGVPGHPDYSGLVTADFDGDGDLDVYVSHNDGPNALWRNDGDLTFTDVSLGSGVDDPGRTVGCSAGDYDGDGWVDLYVVNRDPFVVDTNRLYRNLGGLVFEETTFDEEVDEIGPSFQSVFFDMDKDGDVDLYVSNDKGETLGYPCRLWRNEGGHYTDVTLTSGAGIEIDAMGVGWGDIDRNGYLDLYVTNTSTSGVNTLLLNQGDGVFVDGTADYGVGLVAGGWAGTFFDFDHDGYEDLYACDAAGPNQFYRGGATLPLTEMGAALGLALSTTSYCAVAGDIDRDGDLDLVVQSANWPIELFVNHEGELRNWIDVRLSSSTPNTTAIGATVEVRTGLQWQVRPIRGGGSYKDSPPHSAHFGLDTATVVDEIRVLWPGGAMTTLPGPIDVNQSLVIGDSTVDPEVRLLRGDANGDGLFDISDSVSTLNHLFGGVIAPCEAALDTNSDDVADISDVVYGLAALFSFGTPLASPHPDCGVAPPTLLPCLSPTCP